MADILKTVSGKSAFLLPWLLAALIFVGAAALFLVPAAQRVGVATDFGTWSEVTRGLVLATVTVALGILLSVASTPLYRFLEGYVWPGRLRDWGVGRQRRRKERLVKKLASVRRGSPAEAVLYEKLGRYPNNDEDLLPTRLGNAIKSFEVYGYEHFQLNSQALWIELLGVAPKYVQDEADNGRTGSDFAVALTYLSLGYAATAMALGLVGCGQGRVDVSTWVQVAVLVFSPIAYGLAVVSTDYWGQSVRALVNLGRKPLAEALGLHFPASLRDERAMWLAISDFVYSPYEDDKAQKVDAGATRPEVLEGSPEELRPTGCLGRLAAIVQLIVGARNRRIVR